MDPNGSYHSGVHVLNMAIQATAGLPLAMFCTEALWHAIPGSHLTGIEVLVGMLEGAGFECRAIELGPGDAAPTVCEHLHPGNLVAMNLLPFGPTGPTRWGVAIGLAGGKLEYAVCVQPGDYMVEDVDLIHKATGEIVVVDLGVEEVPTVIASSPEYHGATISRN